MMSRNIVQKIFLCLILLTAGYFFGSLTTSCTISAKKYEYKIVPVSIMSFSEEQLNSMAAAGWEYVDLITDMRGFDTGKGKIIFRK